VVIPVFNKAELTEQCLESLFGSGDAYAAVFVINNGSTDSTVELLQKFGQQITVIHNAQNVGFGRACNQGIRAAFQAQAEWIAILNNDTWLMPGWGESLAREADRLRLDCVGPFFDERPLGLPQMGDERPLGGPQTGGSRLLAALGSPANAELQTRAQNFVEQNRRPKLRNHFVPMLMFWRASSLAKLKLDHGGVFDERFFVTYEDTDLLHRARELKMKWGETNQCYIWHASRATRGDAQLLPSGYEEEGLRLFIQKWGFDPREADHTLLAKLKRKWREGRRRRGVF
jgi:GT2 family glycosyltransferase